MADMTRWDVFAELSSLREQLDRLLGRGGRAATWAPAMDVHDKGDTFVVRADVPGIDPEDIELVVEGDKLTLRGERRSVEEVDEEHTYRLEQRYGRFERSVTLPAGSDVGGITALCDKGVLEVRVPKTAETKPRRLTIRRGGEAGAGGMVAEAGETAHTPGTSMSGLGMTGTGLGDTRMTGGEPREDLPGQSRREGAG